MKVIEIGNIGNYYGGLNVFTKDGKYYWFIENYDHPLYDSEPDIDRCEEISESLFYALLSHNGND